MSFKIEYRKKKMPRGFIGMNSRAAEELNVPFKHKNKKVIEVYIGEPKKIIEDTIRHEEIEFQLMAQGMHYKYAHKIALKYEKRKGSIRNIMNEIKRKEKLVL